MNKRTKLPTHRLLQRRMAGFTLIEAIMVIVITGIVASIVAVFIRYPVQGYVDSVRRAELTDQADVALRRMSRDVRLALPNSLRVTSANVSGITYFFIEFIMTSAGGRYRDPSDGSTAGDFLNFSNATDRTFDVLGTMPAMVAGDFIVVYNLGPGYAPADAYNGGNIAPIASIAGNNVTLTTNPFAAQTPPLASPNGRFQVVPAATGAVSYRCPSAAVGDLTRFWGYGFAAAQPTAPGGASAPLASGNATCVVSYTPAATGRIGLLNVQLTLTSGVAPDVETVTLSQQVHVDNSP
jgi:MSHA biogenesis protein MshO